MRRVNPRATPKRGRPNRQRPSRMRRVWNAVWAVGPKRLGLGLVAVTFLAVVGGLWLDGWFERQADAAVAAVERGSAAAGFALRDVQVEGRQRSDPTLLLQTLDVEPGSPLLFFDPHDARLALEALPWIRSASVERRLPDVLYLRLEEHEPLALWQNAGKLAVIGRKGDVIAGAVPKQFTSLPLVVGPDAPKHAQDLLLLLAKTPELSGKLAAAVRVGQRRWNLKFENGLEVRLPEQGAAGAWRRFASLNREHGLLERDLTFIDLRQEDRVILRTRSGELPLQMLGPGEPA